MVVHLLQNYVEKMFFIFEKIFVFLFAERNVFIWKKSFILENICTEKKTFFTEKNIDENVIS